MEQTTSVPGIDWLRQTGIVAIVRGIPAETALQVADALYTGGIRVLEVALNPSSAPITMLQQIQAAYGDKMWVGAGTVLDVALAETALRSGAQFFVTPNVDERVIAYGVQHHIPVFPGALTATEVVKAFQAGAVMVKIFPSGSMGPQYIKELQGPLAHIPLMAVGGISVENAAAYLQAGARAVGVGGNLVDKAAILAGDFARIRRTARELVNVVQDALVRGS